MSHYLRAACALVFLCGVVSAPGLAQNAPAPTKARPDPARCTKPAWPKEALRQAQVGPVTVEFLIGADGRAHDVKMLQSSSFAPLDGAALKAVGRCGFFPATENGKPVPSWYNMMFVFTLGDERTSALVGEPPRALQAFMLKANQADGIADPLERCLAFPDLPGNAWAGGLAKAACHLMADPPISRQQLAAHLAAGTMDELEELYHRDLERHFTRFGFSEVIHRDFAQFDGSEDAGRLSASWLAKAPRSPFAHAARGTHLAAQAWKASVAGDPQRVSDLSKQAVALFADALILERRLLPAHAGMVDMARLDGNKRAGDAAFANATAIDPACHPVTEQHMLALGPRFGGSLDAMNAYAMQLAPWLEARPLVELNMVLPLQERADDLFEAGDYRAAVKLLDGAALRTPSADLLVTLGLSRIGNQQDLWESLVPLLAASRFADDSFRGALARGDLLLRAGASEWAVKALRRAHEMEPGNRQSSFALGMALYAALDYKEAEPLVIRGLGDEKTYPDTRLILGDIAMHLGQFDKAAQYSGKYVQDNPASARGWYSYGYAKMLAGNEPSALEGFATFLRLVDVKDRRYDVARSAAQQFIAGDRSRTAINPAMAEPAAGSPQT
jgi:TonB family protein